MAQYAELSAHTRRGARGLIVPPSLAIGSARFRRHLSPRPEAHHHLIAGAFALRMAIGNLATTLDDVRRAWELIRLPEISELHLGAGHH